MGEANTLSVVTVFTGTDPHGPMVNWFGGLDFPGIDGGAGVGTLLWSVSGTSEMLSDIDS